MTLANQHIILDEIYVSVIKKYPWGISVDVKIAAKAPLSRHMPRKSGEYDPETIAQCKILFLF